MPHPGAGAEGNAPTFYSPFQPPGGLDDLRGDLLAAEGAWVPIMAGGGVWRVRVPDASALAPLVDAHTAQGAQRVRLLSEFLVRQMHADDMAVLLNRMSDPDDPFDEVAYNELYRAAVTVGTARPFWQSSPSPAQRRITGGPSAPVLRLVVD